MEQEQPKRSRFQQLKAKVRSLFKKKSSRQESKLTMVAEQHVSTRSSKSSDARPAQLPSGGGLLKEDCTPARQRGFVVTDTRLIVSKQCTGLCIRQDRRKTRHVIGNSSSAAIDDDLVDLLPMHVTPDNLSVEREFVPGSDGEEVPTSAHQRIALHTAIKLCGRQGSSTMVSPQALNGILRNQTQQRLALTMLLHESCRHAFMVGYYKEYVSATLNGTALDLELYKFQFDCDWKPLVEDVQIFLDERVPLSREHVPRQSTERRSRELLRTARRNSIMSILDQSNPVHVALSSLLQLELFQRMSSEQQFVAIGLREVSKLLEIQNCASAAEARNSASSSADAQVGSWRRSMMTSPQGPDDATPQSSSAMFGPSSERFTMPVTYSPSNRSSRRGNSVLVADEDNDVDDVQVMSPCTTPVHLPLQLFLEGDRKAALSYCRRQHKLKLIAAKSQHSSI